MSAKRNSFISKLLRFCATVLAIFSASSILALIYIIPDQEASAAARIVETKLAMRARIEAFEKSANLPDKKDASPSECLKAAAQMVNLLEGLYKDAGMYVFENPMPRPVARTLCENIYKYGEWLSLYLLKESSNRLPNLKKIGDVSQSLLRYRRNLDSFGNSSTEQIIQQYSMRIGENLYYAAMNMHKSPYANKEIKEDCLNHAIDYLRMASDVQSIKYREELFELKYVFYR